MDEHPHIPGRDRRGEFQQGPIGHVQTRGEIHQKPLRGAIHLHFQFRRVILKDHLWQAGRFKLESRRNRVARVPHIHRLKLRQALRPYLRVVPSQFRPVDRELRRRRGNKEMNPGIQCLQPVDGDPVRDQVLALGKVIRDSIRSDETPIGHLPAHRQIKSDRRNEG